MEEVRRKPNIVHSCFRFIYPLPRRYPLRTPSPVTPLIYPPVPYLYRGYDKLNEKFLKILGLILA